MGYTTVLGSFVLSVGVGSIGYFIGSLHSRFSAEMLGGLVFIVLFLLLITRKKEVEV